MAISQSALQQVLLRVLPRIDNHRKQNPPKKQTNNIGNTRKPFILGISGLQGSGKSTWAESLARRLQDIYGFKTIVVSLDDFYHNHESLVKIRSSHPTNTLLQNRGQPGTHDEMLAQRFFTSLNSESSEGDIILPSFDKSKYSGEGDRVPEEDWQRISRCPPVDILIFEGWCVGFQALSEKELEAKWTAAGQREPLERAENGISTDILRNHPLDHIKLINSNLRRYNETFMNSTVFDYLIHLDTDELVNVYRWRLDQEHALKKSKGNGMSDQGVIQFIHAYMPAYELYLEKLQQNQFVKRADPNIEETQLRVMLNEERKVVSVGAL